MRELENFIQDDLNNHDIMVVDCFNTVYMWIGLKSNKTERSNVLQKVQEYIENVEDGRNKEKVNYVPVDPCSEPIVFKGVFPEWEEHVAEKWLQPDPYEAMMQEMAAEREAYVQEKYGANEDFASGDTKFPLEELKASCPDGVDPATKE